MNHHSYNRFLAITASLTLMSCATTSDPHKGGFWDGVVGLSSGEYERRLEEKRAELDELQYVESRLLAKRRHLSREQQAVDSERRRLTFQLQTSEQALSEVEALYRHLREVKKMRSEELDQLSQDIVQLRSEMNGLISRQVARARLMEDQIDTLQNPGPASAADTASAAEIQQDRGKVDELSEKEKMIKNRLEEILKEIEY